MDMVNLERDSSPLTNPEESITIHRFFFPSDHSLTAEITSARREADFSALKDRGAEAKAPAEAEPCTEPARGYWPRSG